MRQGSAYEPLLRMSALPNTSDSNVFYKENSVSAGSSFDWIT
jgi:hypothetical protein